MSYPDINSLPPKMKAAYAKDLADANKRKGSLPEALSKAIMRGDTRTPKDTVIANSNAQARTGASRGSRESVVTNEYRGTSEDSTAAKKPNKYRNVPTVVDGIRFDSLKEGKRYGELKLLEKAGIIRNLQADKKQIRYQFVVNGQDVGRYTPDFVYVDDATNAVIAEDCKSPSSRTEAYMIRKRLMKALYGIEILET